ncbi:MAG TPA: PQQ-dependent sugar dehydrogenase, partial [Enhygromyxa sp.]|nr:PQQ-dependent sugar dehydrogenase [Enhygromyxa sp.]
GPDGWLYIGIGAPCNVCESDDPMFASISRIRPDGTGFEVFASGVRNSVGFDWHPASNELWFTDNGRDSLGDDIPPDELNRAPVEGLHFGFPYCHGGELLDPQFGEDRSCEEFVGPVQKLGPHVAALGMRFYDGPMFPARYRNSVIIAEHGSWDRSEPIGYRVMTVLLDADEAYSYEPLVEGFLDPQSGEAWGRPVDVAVLDDGSLLVSDDENGAIYRVTY